MNLARLGGGDCGEVLGLLEALDQRLVLGVSQGHGIRLLAHRYISPRCSTPSKVTVSAARSIRQTARQSPCRTGTRSALGKEKARADYLPIELVRRLSAGEHPVRVWRAHRGLGRDALAAAAGIAPSYLSEIETRRKPGSFAALTKLAAALSISLDDLAAWLEPQRD
jgi:DNA-binding Xre family transcriptional regulator